MTGTLLHNNAPWKLNDTALAKLIGTLTSQESDAKEDKLIKK